MIKKRRWHCVHAPRLQPGRCRTGPASPLRDRTPWRPVRLVVLSALVFAAVSGLLSMQAAVAVDERNIEKYAVRRVEPSYPPLAQKQRIEGVVVVQVGVGGNGRVTNAEFLRGNNIFRSVSVEAARKWEFKVPAGETLEGTIRFAFKLEGS